MKKFSKQDEIKIFSIKEVDYKGQKTSKGLLTLSKKYLGKIVLEIGGGSGVLNKHFKRKYKNQKEITSIDLIPKSKSVIYGDSTNLNFENNYFDTIISADLIEHLNNEDLDKSLLEIKRVLKTGGHAIINTIYNEDFTSSTVVCPDCGLKFHRYGHSQIFSEKRIRQLFDNDFEIIKIKKINLSYFSRSKFLSRLIYFFNLDKYLNNSNNDLFFIVKKVKNM